MHPCAGDLSFAPRSRQRLCCRLARFLLLTAEVLGGCFTTAPVEFWIFLPLTSYTTSVHFTLWSPWFETGLFVLPVGSGNGSKSAYTQFVFRRLESPASNSQTAE